MKQKIEINGTELELAFDKDGNDNADDIVNKFISDQDIDNLISDDDTREWAYDEYDEYETLEVCGINLYTNVFDIIDGEGEWGAVKEANEDSIKDAISTYIYETIREHLDCTEEYEFGYYECSITVYPKEEGEEEGKTPVSTDFIIHLPPYHRMLANKDIRVTVTDDESTTDTSALEKALLMVGIQRVFDPYNGNIPEVVSESWDSAYNYAQVFARTVLADIVSDIRSHYTVVEREEVNLPWNRYINLLNGEQMVATVTPVTESAQEGE